MSTAIIVDLVLLGIILIFVIVGLCKGLFRMIMNFVKSILAVVGASYGSKLLAPKVTELVLPIFKKKVLSSIIAALPKNMSDLSLPSLHLDFSDLGVDSSVVSEYIQKVKGSASNSLNVAGSEIYKLLAERIEGAADSLVATGVRALLFLALFFILGILLGILVSIIDNAFELPIIRTFNKGGGALLGLIEAMLIIYLSLYAVKLLNLPFVENLAAGTVLLNFFYNGTLLQSTDFLKNTAELASGAVEKAAEAAGKAAEKASDAVQAVKP